MRLRLIAPLACLALGCAGGPPIVQLTLASTEPVAETTTVAEQVTGRYCFTRSFLEALLTPPWRARRADHGLAMAAAMDRVPTANVLTDVVLRVDVSQYLLFERTCAVVTGRAARTR